MAIPGRLPDGPLISLRLREALATIEPNDPKNFPPREVQVERSGWKSTLGIGGLVVGGAGVLGAGVSLLRALGSGGSARVHMPMMLAFGAATLVGTGGAGLSRIIPPRTEHALAAGIPTRAQAELVDREISGRTKIVETTDGTFAILRDTSPVSSGGGSGSSGGSRSGGGSRPSGGGYNPPSYPSGGGGSTSRGDDSGGSRNSTSNGNPGYDDF